MRPEETRESLTLVDARALEHPPDVLVAVTPGVERARHGQHEEVDAALDVGAVPEARDALGDTLEEAEVVPLAL